MAEKKVLLIGKMQGTEVDEWGWEDSGGNAHSVEVIYAGGEWSIYHFEHRGKKHYMYEPVYCATQEEALAVVAILQGG